LRQTWRFADAAAGGALDRDIEEIARLIPGYQQGLSAMATEHAEAGANDTGGLAFLSVMRGQDHWLRPNGYSQENRL
jgi:hypothetical protein